MGSDEAKAHGLVARLRRHWFILAVLVSVWLAHLNPQIGRKGGPLRPEFTVKYGAVAIIFFLSGLTLKTERLAAAAWNYKIHLFVQCYTLVLVPLLMISLVVLLKFALGLVFQVDASSVSDGKSDVAVFTALLQGFLVVGCMPPPVSSAVILTKVVGGDVAVAIFNSTLGSFLGILVSPMLLLLVVGVSGSVPVGVVFIKLGATVLLPLAAGQALRSIFQARARAQSSVRVRAVPEAICGITLSNVGKGLLVLIIYSVFCDTFSKSVPVGLRHVIPCFLLVMTCQVLMTRLVFLLLTSGVLPFSSDKQTVIAALFAATHKSLTLGMPMLNLVFAADPRRTLYAIPLLIWHPTQILLGSAMVPMLKEWVEADEVRAVELETIVTSVPIPAKSVSQ